MSEKLMVIAIVLVIKWSMEIKDFWNEVFRDELDRWSDLGLPVPSRADRNALREWVRS